MGHSRGGERLCQGQCIPEVCSSSCLMLAHSGVCAKNGTEVLDSCHDFSFGSLKEAAHNSEMNSYIKRLAQSDAKNRNSGWLRI